MSTEMLSTETRAVSFGSSPPGLRFLGCPTLERGRIKRDAEQAGVNKSGGG